MYISRNIRKSSGAVGLSSSLFVLCICIHRWFPTARISDEILFRTVQFNLQASVYTCLPD